MGTLLGKSIFLSQVLWYSLVPETFSKAVGALLRAAARLDQPDGPHDADAAAQPMSCMCPSPHLRPRTSRGHGGNQGRAPREE